MTDENNSLVIEAAADPQGLSYTPDAPEVKEPKAPAAEKPMSSREALEKAAADIEAKGGKIGDAEEKAEPEVKEPKEAKPRAEGGKFAKAEPEPATEEKTQEPPEAKADGDEGTERDGEKDRSSEDRDIDKPPARFLPRAKEKWAEVDADVRGEVHRALQNAEKGLQEHRESHEFRKELREFEDMARQKGTTVKQALAQYTAIDAQLANDPVGAMERILSTVGITPQQYAHHILNAPQQPAANPEISQLKQTVQQLSQQLQQQQQTSQQSQQEQTLRQVQESVIDPFRASLGDDDRYEELQDDIAFFLNSDKIPSTLSAQNRLAAAYDMAERINPVGQRQNTARLNTAPPERPINPAGAKSIKGAPNGTSVPKGANLNSRDAIEAAMRQIGL